VQPNQASGGPLFLIFVVSRTTKNIFCKKVFFLALPWAPAVEAGASEKNIPKGIRIVIDVENQL
jgi:hypothetical protein